MFQEQFKFRNRLKMGKVTSDRTAQLIKLFPWYSRHGAQAIIVGEKFL